MLNDVSKANCETALEHTERDGCTSIEWNVYKHQRGEECGEISNAISLLKAFLKGVHRLLFKFDAITGYVQLKI